MASDIWSGRSTGNALHPTLSGEAVAPYREEAGESTGLLRRRQARFERLPMPPPPRGFGVEEKKSEEGGGKGNADWPQYASSLGRKAM